MKDFLKRSRPAAAIVLLSLYVALISSRKPPYDGYYKAMFGDMIYGTAWRPFVGRCFIPFVVRLATGLIPQTVKSFLASLLTQTTVLGHHSLFSSSDPFLIERLLFWCLDIGALICFAYGVWRFMRMFGLPRNWSYLSALIVLGSIPTFFNYSNYIYDASSMALFTWSLVYLVEKKWFAYLPLFAICVWNKETGILLGWVFLLIYWRALRSGSKKYWFLLLSQGAIALLILGAIHFAFESNPGGSVEWHLFDRKGLLFVYSIETYLTVLGLSFLLFYKFREQPLFLQKAFTVLPILVTLTFFFGLINEYRDYFEALPIVATMISITLYRIAHQVGLIPEKEWALDRSEYAYSIGE